MRGPGGAESVGLHVGWTWVSYTATARSRFVRFSVGDDSGISGVVSDMCGSDQVLLVRVRLVAGLFDCKPCFCEAVERDCVCTTRILFVLGGF